ncbi:MAG: NAD(P)H-dependent glycerol-3-phosphate dehydrogenase [Lysobacteraceae bacterium]|nr:NAD(P)-dependent glycerol-3-phosphate dehydrogenase [Xanthomonadales bacterium]HPF73564.1 NAD(P)H-dependent glycerol-3-phosphate dehydrogenase [Xanthomonadaceae bacterium]HRX99436.1 NAD(P)H-dependent glycerol-3-phosphate dehydrogenase [Xanthomonadaceae bacterium]
MSERPRVTVLGAGSWGTALASLSARNGNPTTLWGRDAEALAGMSASRRNRRYLPDCDLPESLAYQADLGAACADADLLLVVVPSHAFAGLVSEIAGLRPGLDQLAWASKGFEAGSGRFLHEVAAELLGESAACAVVTGPSFAREVVQNLPTAVTVHSPDDDFAQRVAAALHAPTFRAYTGSDLVGAELGGAMKNVLAVATGVADGMGLGLNARAGLITRGLNEMLRLNVAIGGRAETLMGLAGLGDLVLTATGDLSRNRRLGLALGRGHSLDDAVREIGQVVESVQTADEVMRLAERHGVELPISASVRRMLHGDITPREGLQLLLAREQKPEYSAELFG